MESLATERLILRKFKPSDATAMFNNWAKDPENVKYLTWEAHKNIEETGSILKEWIFEYQNPKCYRWCITLKDRDEAIGGIDVRKIINKDSCEVGYVLSKSFWNQGIMTEALNAVINYLFTEGFKTITASHHVNNPASGRVMQKCGIKFVEKVGEKLRYSIKNQKFLEKKRQKPNNSKMNHHDECGCTSDVFCLF